MSIAPIEPIDQPELPKPSPRRRRSLGLEALFGLVVAAVVVAFGAPVGLLWSWVAPKVELVQTPYGPAPIEAAPEGYFADDGWFMILGAAAGILLAVAAWIVLRRYRGPFILAGLVIGSAAAAALAAWLGNKVGYAHYLDLAEHAPVNTHIFRPAKVRAGEAGLWLGFVPWVRGSLLIQALVAAVIYTCLAGFHTSPTLTHDPDPDVPTGDPYFPGYPHDGGPYAGPAHPAFGSLDPSRPGPVYPGPAQPGPGIGHAQPGFEQSAQSGPGHEHPGYAHPGHGQSGYGPPSGGTAPFGQPIAEGNPSAGLPPWPGPPTGDRSSAGNPATGDQPASGQPYGDPAPGRPDLRKPTSGATGAGGPPSSGQHDGGIPGTPTPPPPGTP
ncbi:DUF2567 domain-containing protein [Dactylosporangium sp. NPDC000521]|uniref:DUF2567 domain-containing protein n=1 Tax=Dactylosporangium sp. NPDC000521 TaxID=3363975 RepID=UPI0036918AF8